MGTRKSNSSKHPGLVIKTTTRRTSEEVKAATEAKEAEKAAKKQTYRTSVKRVADFESQAMVNDEITDATPRPNFARPHARVPDSDVENENNSEGTLVSPTWRVC
jgi:hypothetical protein